MNNDNGHRWYIAFNVKPRLRTSFPHYHKLHYVRYVWPVLFKSREEAWAAIETRRIFQNSEATKTRGKIVSASVKHVRLRRAG